MSAHQLLEVLRVPAEKPSEYHETTYRITHLYMRGAHGWRLVCRHVSAAKNGESALPAASKTDTPRLLH